MVWPIRSRIISSVLRSKAPLVGSCVHGDSVISSITKPHPKFMNWVKSDGCHASSLPSFKEKQPEDLSNESKDLNVGNYMVETDGYMNLFGLMKQRFLNFKNQKYIKELEHFQSLAEAQYPKFMVIACADSRVCPSNILGFQPGEVFMIRNIANLVPVMKNGPSECNAALQFAVTTLQVENILVIGHSSCAGIEALMSMKEDTEPRNFIHNWVANGKVAKLKTKATTSHLSFDQQCRFCEKESINQSLLNLLSYPWLEDRVKKELLCIHGGYYNFSNCSFEKWTLDFKGCNVNEERSSYVVKEKEFWS
ncbi:beta carbonic anhydrase 5, chloroplastic-like isoform X1 [Trifolium pratense]|uniref:beta carbonic anhydrase 5, chloroplastic-like isoform X1 n=2 Tax=Trifolium pratense TaxID=57577 RepID=UPI001E691569|nr:beta carbonic anhydrase 5, chloroplastic-like isoform X1 [Trifolium pratense]